MPPEQSLAPIRISADCSHLPAIQESLCNISYHLSNLSRAADRPHLNGSRECAATRDATSTLVDAFNGPPGATEHVERAFSRDSPQDGLVLELHVGTDRVGLALSPCDVRGTDAYLDIADPHLITHESIAAIDAVHHHVETAAPMENCAYSLYLHRTTDELRVAFAVSEPDADLLHAGRGVTARLKRVF